MIDQGNVRIDTNYTSQNTGQSIKVMLELIQTTLVKTLDDRPR